MYDIVPNIKFLHNALFVIWAILLFAASATMCVALWKMKSTIATSKKGKVNWKLMINHASAFILFLVGYIGTEFIDYFTKDYYYILWIVIAVFGTVSMFCLAVLLWHLGSKDEESKFAFLTTGSSQKETSLHSSVNIESFEQDEVIKEEVHLSGLNERIWRAMLISNDGDSVWKSIYSSTPSGP